MRIRLFNLVYFQTTKQLIEEEEKQVKNILSTHSKQSPTIFIKTIN